MQEIVLETSFFIKITMWLCFLILYLFHLLQENLEAYYNPRFQREDLNLKSYHVTGSLAGNPQEKFIVTNISENGFYAVFDELNKAINIEFKAVVFISGEEYQVLGRVVERKYSGMGVKVVIDDNWNKLYSKVKKLKILD